MAKRVSTENPPDRGVPHWVASQCLHGVAVFVCLIISPQIATATEFRASPRASSAAVLARWDQAESMLDAGDLAGARQHYVELLSVADSELAAIEGLALLREATCDGDSSLFAADTLTWARGGDPVVSDTRTDFRQAARRAHRAATRWRHYGYSQHAAPLFADASRFACAAADTFAGLLYSRAAILCAVRAGRPATGRAWLDTADSLFAALVRGGGDATAGLALPAVAEARERLRLDLRLASANLANAEGDYAQADSLFAALAAAAKTHGWRRLRCDAMLGLAAVHSRQRRPQSATIRSQEALDLARDLGDRNRQAQALILLGYDETQQNDLEAAQTALQEAMSLVDACGFGHLRAYAQTGLAALAEARGDRMLAVAGFRRAYVEHASFGSETGELGARQRLAYNLLILGHYGEAIFHYEKCMEILARQDSLVMRNWVLAGLALAYHRLGRLELAADYYRRSLVVNRRLGDRASEAWALRSLGILYTMRGDCRQALIHIESARVLSDSLGSTEEVGNAHAALAYVHLSLGDLEQSRYHFVKALALADSARYDDLRRNAASGLTALYREAERPDEARRYGGRALAVARQWKDRSAILEALADLAELHLEGGHSDSARVALAECRQLLDDGNALLFGARVALLEARAAPTSAIAAQRAEEALDLAVQSGLPEREWMAYLALADAQSALGDTAAALHSLESALAVVESLRRAVGSDELRRQMLRPPLAPYERLVAMRIAGGHTGDPALQALAVTERARAQLLATRLRQANVQQEESRPNGPSSTDNEQERELLARIAYLQTRLQDGALAPAQRLEFLKETYEREDEVKLLRLRLAGTEAAYAEAAYPLVAEPASLLEALEPGELAISYFLGAGASYAFAVSRSGVAVHLLPDRRDLEERVQRFLRLRTTVAADAALRPPASALARAGRDLYALLLSPSLAGADSATALIIIPDGLLHSLPFAALQDERDTLLGRRTISLAPSLRTLGSLCQRERVRRLKPPPRIPMIAIGAEGGGGSFAPGERLLPYDGRVMDLLPGAKAEARQVAALFPGAVCLTGKAATERSVRTSPLNAAGALHFAAHGHADARQVRRSSLVLNLPAGDPSVAAEIDARHAAASAEDGLLQWDEIAALPLRAGLVTLSACRSAAGVLAGGEGVIGLTQAFLHAGAGCVLATLGDVRDDRALWFVTAFYEQWGRGLTAVAALRAVQARARTAPPFDEYTAAEFVLIGDGSVRISASPTARRSLAFPRWPLALAAAVVVAAVLIRRRRARPLSR